MTTPGWLFHTLVEMMKNWSTWGILLPCAKCFIVTKCLWNGAPGSGSVSLSRDDPPWVFYHPCGCFITRTLNSPAAGNWCLEFGPLLSLYYSFLFLLLYFCSWTSMILPAQDISWSFQLRIFPNSQILSPELPDLCWSHKSTPRAGVDLIVCPQVCHKHFTFYRFPTWASPDFLPE